MDRAARIVTDEVSLLDATPGARVTVAGFDGRVSPVQLEQLLSYGVVEGRAIEVLAQRPVTIVLVDHTELALENLVARGIRVQPC